MGHAHVVVIDDHGQHVDWRPVRPQDDHVIQRLVLDDDAALHLVVDHRLTGAGGLHPDRIGCVGMGGGIGVAPGRQEDGIAPRGLFRRTEGGDVFLCGKALVSRSSRKHLMRHLGMTVAARELADRFAIPVKAKPGQPAQDGRRRFGGGPFAVGVFDPQQELATAPPGIKPVEQGGPPAADVQIARRGRGEAGDDRAVGGVGR